MQFYKYIKNFICFILLYTILCSNSSIIYSFNVIVNGAEIINDTNEKKEEKKEEKKDILQLTAKTAVLIDAKTGIVIYDKNMNEKMYPASITKILTALIAIEKLKDGDIIKHSHNAVYNIGQGSSNIGMLENEELTLDEALHAILLKSANEVCMAVAEKVSGSVEEFCKLMNKRAKKIGAKNTHFANPHGFHDDNHYSTSYDMALIMKEAIKNPKFLEIIKTQKYIIPKTNMRDEPIILYNSDKFIKKDSPYFYEYVVGGKTGYTNEAGNTLVTYSKKADMELVSVVMKSDGKESYVDSKKMIEYGFGQFAQKTIFKKGDYQGKEPVIQKYKEREIALGEAYISAKNDITLNVPKNIDTSGSRINYKVNLKTPLVAPLNVGDTVGTLDITYNGNTISTVDIVSKDKIDIIPEKKLQRQELFKKIKKIIIKILIVIFCIMICLFIFIIITRFIAKKIRIRRARRRYRTNSKKLVPMKNKKRKKKRKK